MLFLVPEARGDSDERTPDRPTLHFLVSHVSRYANKTRWESLRVKPTQ